MVKQMVYLRPGISVLAEDYGGEKIRGCASREKEILSRRCQMSAIVVVSESQKMPFDDSRILCVMDAWMHA